MQDYKFKIELSVRDYECDLQGIVNNAVYQNYLEHARHEYLKSIGLDFAECTRKGINLVVVRIELDYKFPLKSGDRFVVGLNFEKESPVRFVFYQDIYRLPDEKLILKGKVTGTALNEKGRPDPGLMP
ncbi:thioesterase [candidate division WOR-1 bacterium RIFOXYA12_FULL_43_27]|uniref:Thioesterase n=1 Tax=candidate division WOR-1 bacterium RIFOXYC2_FULL_46_14 TaxID=1802587 RepID=A0A1F4U7G2_UNCSA|nr:MAG: thioesterase [candidate division WOR-1 bacterium RIFOXYA12_FULL_43_27]OGC19227.1 MAG: thioesterase [candidate division WOR-1 bacterium RIFOXYB2_FULL_46_45]OGC30216.1 MAG: thioesterase [candidate division WOR-1 bacterium RIFOXYA2_FULL_46_56]OGC40817.1 MAG: thioesterase [candidate division WOR-1 bacterium RIFOXYC2_FULL_46_14]